MKARVIEDELRTRAFLDSVEDVTWQTVAAVLYAYHLQGYRKQRLQNMYETIKSVFDMPQICGRELEGFKVIEFLKMEYGIDVTELKPKTDDEYTMNKRKR